MSTSCGGCGLSSKRRWGSTWRLPASSSGSPRLWPRCCRYFGAAERPGLPFFGDGFRTHSGKCLWFSPKLSPTLALLFYTFLSRWAPRPSTRRLPASSGSTTPETSGVQHVAILGIWRFRFKLKPSYVHLPTSKPCRLVPLDHHAGLILAVSIYCLRKIPMYQASQRFGFKDFLTLFRRRDTLLLWLGQVLSPRFIWGTLFLFPDMLLDKQYPIGSDRRSPYVLCGGRGRHFAVSRLAS